MSHLKKAMWPVASLLVAISFVGFGLLLPTIGEWLEPYRIQLTIAAVLALPLLMLLIWRVGQASPTGKVATATVVILGLAMVAAA